jgi:3-oxoacyl-[acyl-carrier-protein] synthase II
MRRVAITGIGLLTALGVGVDATWDGLTAGRSGIAPIQGFDASSLRTRLGAEILDFRPQDFVTNRRMLRMMTRGDQYALVAASLAVHDSQVDLAVCDGERAALFVGGNKEISNPTHVLEAVLSAREPDGTVDMQRFGTVAQATAYPLFFVEGLQGASLFYISQAFGLNGANSYFAGTAEAGAMAIGAAFRAIRRGEADVALAGGFDDPIAWWSMSKLDGLAWMTGRNDLGAAACRPFDRERAGTVVGDGAAFLMLEEYEAAVNRGAHIYAEITAWGSGFDASTPGVPHPEGRGLSRAIEAALGEARLAPDAIDYVAAHGSATQAGDASEARALQAVFGATSGRPLTSSVKAATGHLIAAAGALNTAIAALAIARRIAPPTLNLDDPDPACALEHVTGESCNHPIDQALALARGLAGQSVALAMRAAR